MILHPIVKHGVEYWMLEKVENGVATLWRDGKRKEVPQSEVVEVESMPPYTL